MKRVFQALCLMICMLPLATIAQTETKKGFVVTENDQRIEGQLQESFKKGKLVMTQPDNARKMYAPSELKSFTLDDVNYISYSNDFYKEVASGNRAHLYQKVTDNSGEKIYNGAEIVGYVTTTSGRRGDYYLLRSGASMDLITKKNFRDYFLKLFSNNESLVSKIRDKSLDYDQLKEAVDLYNFN